MKRLVLGLGLGTALAYVLRSRIGAGSSAQPVWQGGSSVPEDSMRAGDSDDTTLADRVESQIFRDTDVPKGQVNVNAEYGRVILRGEVESEDLIRDLVDRTREVDGVRDVESLLHTPGQEAPAAS